MNEDDQAWVTRLADAGILLPSAEPGLYGRSALFESIVGGIERAVAEVASPDAPVVRRFAPVMAVDTLVRAGYPRSFPDLIGTISSFRGTDADHAAMLARLDSGGDWQASLSPAATALCSAACQPLYPTLPGTLPAGGLRFDVYGWVFRHEPSADPARQQAFRQYEQVYVGEPDTALEHGSIWRSRATDLLQSLGLDVTVAPANDPFFGRAGRLLANGQIEAGLKYEITGTTGPTARATALASTNCHREHFGEAFSILSADGEPAHSACIGFGVERITLALLWAHGLDPSRWPEPVVRRLGL